MLSLITSGIGHTVTDETQKMTERLKAEFQESMGRIRDAIGPEAFEELAVRACLPYESQLRREHPEHPMLALIDEWHARTGTG